MLRCRQISISARLLLSEWANVTPKVKRELGQNYAAASTSVELTRSATWHSRDFGAVKGSWKMFYVTVAQYDNQTIFLLFFNPL